MRKLYHRIQRILHFYKQFFNRDIRYINNSFSKQLALTFDDGPDPLLTDQVLDFLSEQNISATFFLSGPAIEKSPEIVARIVNQGHCVGNHGYEHVLPADQEQDEMISGFEKTDQSIKDISGNDFVRFYRPPYGKVTSAFNSWVKKKSAYTVHWSLDSYDYRSEFTSGMMAEMLLRDVKSGDIILLHDTKPVTISLLKKIVPELQKRNYQFLKLDERFR